MKFITIYDWIILIDIYIYFWDITSAWNLNLFMPILSFFLILDIHSTQQNKELTSDGQRCLQINTLLFANQLSAFPPKFKSSQRENTKIALNRKMGHHPILNGCASFCGIKKKNNVHCN